MINKGNSRLKFYVGNTLVSEMYKGDTLVHSTSRPVIYYIDEGVEPKTEEVKYGESCLNPSFTPVKKDWDFVGWRKDTVATKEVLDSLTMWTEPVKLYAVFKQTIERKFVSYGTVEKFYEETVEGTRYHNNENTVNASIVVPEAKRCDDTGWIWRGWAPFNNAEANPDNGIFAENITLENVSVSGTHYGLYYINVRVTYQGNGSTSGSSDYEEKKRYWSAADRYENPKFTIKNNWFERTGYDFSAWTAEGTTYSAGQKDVTFIENTTLYAKWTATSYSITYTLNGGTNPSGASTSYTIESNTITLPTPTRKGYTFGGWYISSSFSGTKVTSIAEGSTGNKTYYAKWTATSYSITYTLNGGTNPSGASTSYTIESNTITLPTPTRKITLTPTAEEGTTSAEAISVTCTFKGWYDSSGNKVTQITKGSTGNKTYTAKWSFDTVTLPTIQSAGDTSTHGDRYTFSTTGFSSISITLYCQAVSYGTAWFSCGNDAYMNGAYDLISTGNEKKSKTVSISGGQGDYTLRHKVKGNASHGATNIAKAWITIAGIS